METIFDGSGICMRNESLMDNYSFKAYTDKNYHFPGEAMKKAALFSLMLCCAFTAFGGFKAKPIKAKKPGKFQCRVTVSGVTYAADLLLEGKDQKKYFHEALRPFNLIAIRLAVFNDGKEEVVLPLNDLRLISAEGVELTRVDPEEVARVVLGENSTAGYGKPVDSGGGIGGVSLPRYDPSDPRNRGIHLPRGPLEGPDVVLNPGGGGGSDRIENERKLAAVDFRNKAHTSDPIVRTLSRDRFLYFSVPEEPVIKEGIVLILPVSKGIPKEVILKF
jgi:hypothetical protein